MVLGVAATVLQILAAAQPALEAARPEPPAALASLEAEQSELFARVAPSVVLLVSEGTSGSGFVVGRDGLVLTNAHVVGEAEEVAVQLLDGRYGRGQVVARASGSLDLALVRIPFADVPPLEAGEPDAARAGTFAATVGHGGGAAWTFSTGLVANPRPLGDGAPLVLAQMALRPGSSGGPLVDRRGRAVAVVTAGTKNASGVTFAIRIDAAARAFPQLAGWVSEPPAVALHGTPASAPAGPPVVESVAVAAVEPVRPVSVARFSGPSAAPVGWDPSLASAPVAMVTVWEASPPKAVRRPLVAAGPGAIGPPVAAHGGDVSSGSSLPSPARPDGAPLARVVAGLLAAIGLGGWIRTSVRQRRR